MKARCSVLGALVVSLASHGALGLLLWHWPAPTDRAAALASPAVHVIYPSSNEADNQPGKLAPGDSAAGEPGPPLPRTGSIRVQVIEGGPQLGPAIPSIPVAGAGTGQSAMPRLAGGATTTFFGVPAQGLRIVYVLDRSCSMGLQGALTAARRELEKSLARLPAPALFQVIEYNTSAAPLLGGKTLLPATPENICLATEALEALTPARGTLHLEALLMALALHPDAIYFLTDADDLNPADCAQVTRANAGASTIHTFELTIANRGHPDMPMQRLARDNHGTYQAIDLLH